MVETMRKRAQRKSKPEITKPKKPKHITKKQPKKVEKFSLSKNGWVAITLISIFVLVLMFNTFFNFSSGVAYNPEGEGLEKYYLSGPDPYYNMRLVEETHSTGEYAFYETEDPLLNYPLGRTGGGRAPLLVMSSLGFSKLLTPFMSEIDAIGLSMQFIPALFGALLVFPVYFIGKTVFNKKAGLIAAFFLAIIPVHIGSGHGSAFSLFDHDSLNLFLFFLTFLFLILSIKEKNSTKSILYAVLGGVPLAGLSMVWTEAQFLYVVIAAYAFVQMIFDIFLNKIELRVFRSSSIILFTGYLISMPVIATRTGGIPFDIPFFLALGVTLFGLLYYMFGMKRIPWTLSLPSVFVIGGIGLGFLYALSRGIIRVPFMSSLNKLANVIFGSGVYGNKVSMTIAEANTYQISNTVMSFGPALYWVGWAGLLMMFYFYYKDKMRREYLFLIILFMINLWLTSTAGRFINDMVPLIAILSGAVVWFVLEKLDYKQMVRNIKSAGGGVHGFRRGAKLLHIFVVLFIGFVIILPNVFLALDASVPNKIYEEDDELKSLKWEIFGEGHSGAFGLSVAKEKYWLDAFNWLRKQDNDILKPEDRPAFISWWDYGFYEVASGEHPTVADNFQDGIPPASNFHTATSESEAVVVWICRLLEGENRNNGKLSDETKNVLEENLGESHMINITDWAENPRNSPSYNELIQGEYHKYFEGDIEESKLVVGAQWAENAFYHDMVDLLVKNENTSITDEEITSLYHDIQESTGYSIRYYGAEGYDKQIFNIFAFLSDKSLILVGSPEDEFVKIIYEGVDYSTYTEGQQISGDFEEYLERPDSEKRLIQITNTDQEYKDAFFNSMFFKTYYGIYKTDQQGNKQIWNDNLQYPCVGMKHFYAEYISDFSKPELQYNYNGKAAVVIAKYYEGAIIDGTVSFMNESQEGFNVVVMKNLSYPDKIGRAGDEVELGEVPINHDQDTTNSFGNFSVIAGAGSYLQITKNLGQTSFNLKNITFDGVDEYAPISDSDAMRTSSNYERYLNISIDPASIQGFIYNDTDDNGVFNVTSEESLTGVNVMVREIKKIENDEITEQGDQKTATTDENGSYSFSDLVPGLYRVFAYDDEGYTIHLTDIEVPEGKKWYNVSKQKPGSVEGTVYYDSNFNGKFDSGEELSDAEVTLSYNDEEVKEVTTDSEGKYRFDSLTSGWSFGETNINEYTIQAVKSPDYEFNGKVFAPENDTKSFNISMDLTPVNVTGEALYQSEGIEGVSIEFTKDESVEDNTAEDKNVTTSSDGTYSVDLRPGSYNITISKTVTQGTEEILVYHGETDTLELTKGQGTATKDFTLIKETVTVSGTVTYEEELMEEVGITFTPYDEVNAISASVISDENGTYSAELLAGNYTINAMGFNLTGNKYNYTDTGEISVSETDIPTGVTKNIIMVREQD